MIRVTREERRQLAKDNAKQPKELTAVPKELWPPYHRLAGRTSALYRSRDYLVQVFDAGNGNRRLTVNRTTLGPDGRWLDGLTWDELQDIKRQVGMGDMYAVEVYPRDKDIVNDANMRHLWVLAVPLDIGF